jgi:hypothetical protein
MGASGGNEWIRAPVEESRDSARVSIEGCAAVANVR